VLKVYARYFCDPVNPFQTLFDISFFFCQAVKGAGGFQVTSSRTKENTGFYSLHKFQYTFLSFDPFWRGFPRRYVAGKGGNKDVSLRRIKKRTPPFSLWSLLHIKEGTATASEKVQCFSTCWIHKKVAISVRREGRAITSNLQCFDTAVLQCSLIKYAGYYGP
jgi:hypothetical protein